MKSVPSTTGGGQVGWTRPAESLRRFQRAAFIWGLATWRRLNPIGTATETIFDEPRRDEPVDRQRLERFAANTNPRIRPAGKGIPVVCGDHVENVGSDKNLRLGTIGDKDAVLANVIIKPKHRKQVGGY